jgi:hypothetical protein
VCGSIYADRINFRPKSQKQFKKKYEKQEMKGNRIMRSYRYFFVIVIAIIILFATAYKARLNEQRHERFLQRDQQIKNITLLREEVNKRIIQAYKKDITLEEFIEYFGKVSKLEDAPDSEHNDKTHLYYHAESQLTLYLRFENNVLAGFNSLYGKSDINSGIVLESKEYLKSESIRKIILSISIISWGIFLALGLIKQNLRNILAIPLITSAILCGLCWFSKPNYSPTLEGIMSNDSLVFFLIIITVSVGFISMNSNLFKTRLQGGLS